MRILERLSPGHALGTSGRPERCLKKFLRYFPKGFADPKYYEWERAYKQEAHERFEAELNKPKFRRLIAEKRFVEIGATAARIESRPNLLFSFEKMAFRDAVKSPKGAEIFAKGLFDLLYGRGSEEDRFERWCSAVEALPRKQTRVLTHPVVTVFPFIGAPQTHIFLKPLVTQRAAVAYAFDFYYNSRPSWKVYSSLRSFAAQIRRDLWVLGSDEYR